MQTVHTGLPGVLILAPQIYSDERGYFYESYNRRVFRQASGFAGDFVQDNHSRSPRGVLRGLHYQVRQTQGKLVRVIAGEVYDVAVDLRRSSPHFGCWIGVHLSAGDGRQLWIPPGFGHGFLVLSEAAEVLYKTSDYYAPEYERSLAWNDPDLGIDWPLPRGLSEPVLSAKDRMAASLEQAEVFP